MKQTKFIQGVDDSGAPVDTGIIERAGMGFDPAGQDLDLTKDEKLRTTALVLAIQAYDKLIIKDAEYLKEMHSEARRDGSVIQPATMHAMVDAALQFEAFIVGRLTRESAQPEPHKVSEVK